MNNSNQSDTSDFEAFVAAGEVEVGESNLTSQEDQQPQGRRPSGNRAARRDTNASQPEESTDEQADEGDGGDEEEDLEPQDMDEAGDDQDGDDQDEQPKKQKSSRERIQELNRRLRQEQRDRRRDRELFEDRLAALEKGGLPNTQGSDTSQQQEKPAPDPTDSSKYPLGHLDDRYIEDKLEWLSEKKATERADAVLQRQQEHERRASAERQQQELLGKVDDLAERGSDLHEDFQEIVVEAGMRGDWDLSQTTFEAAHEAENGAQILLELAQDKKEATRVAKLSPLGQLKYVEARDAEISKGKTPRRIPRAGEPPKNTARGANSRTQINPATDNLDDFEKAWEADAKRR